MSEFIDEAGQTWVIKITVNTLKRIKELTEFDLLADREDGQSALVSLLENPVLLVDVLYAICKPLCEEREVSDVAFGESLVGDAIEKASVALIEGLCDFFPKRRGDLLRKTHQKLIIMQEMAEKALEEQIDKLDPELMLGSEDTPKSDQAIGKQSTSTPDTSE